MENKAQVFKIHSDFYYVHLNDIVVECKLKDTLKKQKEEIVVGDIVEISEYNKQSKQAFIESLSERTTFIPRPKVSNIEQMIIVSAVKNPELDLNQLDRYLCLCDYYNITPILCFNKNDLSQDTKLLDEIFSIYEPLGYDIIFTSAKDGIGIDDLEEILENKTSALCGMSGVGKSTLINTINPNLHLRTKEISEKTNRGTHTTRHCEILKLQLSNGKTANIIDTPGFSHLRFDFLLPKDVDILFKDIYKYKNECKFSDCLHITEKNCNVLENIDKIAPSRYESYKRFVEEAKDFKEKITYQGNKKEYQYKIMNNKKITKIGTKNREKARNVNKQSIKTKEDFNV